MGDVLLMCTYGIKTAVLQLRVCKTFSELLAKVKEKFNIMSIDIDILYSIPDYDACVLKGEDDFLAMNCIISSLDLKKVNVSISVNCVSSVSSMEIGESSSGSKKTSSDDVSSCSSRDRVFLSANWGNTITHVGQKFRCTALGFREILLKQACEIGFDVTYRKNTSTNIYAVCKERVTSGCPWKVSASSNETDFFTILTFENQHRCSLINKANAKRLSSKVVAGLITHKVIDVNRKLKPKEVRLLLKDDYGHEITQNVARNALEKAKIEVMGNDNDSYKQLNWYTKAALFYNPGSHIDLELDNNGTYRRIFVAWAACINGYRDVRPMIALDATFLKGLYKGTLMVATAKSGNQELYPVAYAACDAEDFENWYWFLQNLRVVTDHENRPITFLSDRNSGLLKALPMVFPGAAHFYCNLHLKENLRKKFTIKCGKKEKCVRIFQRAAYEPNPHKLESIIVKLKKEGGEVVEQFLKELPYEKWTNAYAQGCRYGEMTSNAAESFNAWAVDVRNEAIKQLIDGLRIKLMQWFVTRKEASDKWTHFLCEKKIAIMYSLTQEARGLLVRQSSAYVFEVFHAEESNIVDLEKRTCSCYQWQLQGFPCAHVVACVYDIGNNFQMSDFIERYWTTETYRRSYSWPITPIPTSLRKNYEKTEDPTIIRPFTKRQPGRPHLGRYKSAEELAKTRAFHCSRCKGLGHNRLTCQAPI